MQCLIQRSIAQIPYHCVRNDVIILKRGEKLWKRKKSKKITSRKRCYIRIISYKTSYKGSLKGGNLLSRKTEIKEVSLMSVKDVDQVNLDLFTKF